MKKIVFLFAALFITLTAAAQRNWGVGLRFGEPAGVTVKKYMGENRGLELTLGTSGYVYRHKRGNGYYQRGGLAMMVNYHIMKDISEVEGLQWYFGFGGTLKVREYYNNDIFENESRLGLAVNGVAGLEYTLSDFPVTFFLDVIPNLEMFPDFFAPGFDGGIGARYNF